MVAWKIYLPYCKLYDDADIFVRYSLIFVIDIEILLNFFVADVYKNYLVLS